MFRSVQNIGDRRSPELLLTKTAMPNTMTTTTTTTKKKKKKKKRMKTKKRKNLLIRI
jgi:hypothetical protein